MKNFSEIQQEIINYRNSNFVIRFFKYPKFKKLKSELIGAKRDYVHQEKTIYRN